ncbi:MAG: hypothetical protein KGZ83_21900 [Sulfuricella sp.]|nr:hypothetical protein [Sulfuricella sp.]
MNTLMNRGRTAFMGGVAVIGMALTAGEAYAYKIEPAYLQDSGSRESDKLKQSYDRFKDHFIQPIHERMAALSFQCSVEKSDNEPCNGTNNQAEEQYANDLSHGARWNDDPNNSFMHDKGWIWLLWMLDAERKADRLDNTYALLYRSHFGDLQFLHAMASAKDDHDTTRNKILAWGRFAYDVATGKIDPAATLGVLARDYDFAKNFSSTAKKDWTVRHLFLNIQDYKHGGKKELRDGVVPDIALGALLHTIQDSYSNSHTTRTTPSTADAPQSGNVKAFLDYTKQKSACHGKADLESDWLSLGSINATDNPVYHGAWIIRRVRDKKPWDQEVGEKLSNIFATADGKGYPGDGGFKDCP